MSYERFRRRSRPSNSRILLRTFVPSFLLPAAVAAGAAILMFQFLYERHVLDRADDEMAWILDATRLIEDRYYEDVTREELAYDAIRGMVQRDPYSDFIDPEMEQRFREENEGRYVGIGFAVYEEGAPVTVLFPFPGSPAEEAELDTGDRIIGVDGEDVSEDSQREIVERIKMMNGEGKPVTLRIQPYTAPGEAPAPVREVTVRRATIWRPSVVDARIVDPKSGVGYVRLLAFQEHSVVEFEKALNSLATKGMKSLVLDLRGNRGGLLDQAIEICSLFLEEDVVVRTEGRSQDATHVYTTSSRPASFRGLPIALLVDNDSASASEIVAGALQDHMRAILVGDRTFGKGMVQSVIPRRYIVDGEERYARIKITTSRYFTPAGRSIERATRRTTRDRDDARGLIPDIFIPITDRAERTWLLNYLADREIDDDTWRKISERCPKRVRHEEGDGGRVDVQLRRAVDALNGTKVLNHLTRTAHAIEPP